MRSLCTLLLGICLCGFGESLRAQALGGFPGQLDWRILRADSVALITTPATLDFARRTLELDRGLIRSRPLSLGPKVRPIDIVVQPSTVVPNGFVSLAPFRSYLYAAPPQRQGELSSLDWNDILAIHEYRHVEQYANLRRGATGLAAFLGGDGGWGLFAGLSTPGWFFEGDAVFAETALTYSGRGRTPAFSALERAVLLQRRRYSYGKAVNGSLKDRVPNEYTLGYTLVSYGHTTYGGGLWPRVLAGAGTYRRPFYPFSSALRERTGLSSRRLYHAAYDSLAARLVEQRDTLILTPGVRVTSDLEKTVDRYNTPLPDGRGGPLLATRSSYTRIPELVRLDAREEPKHLAWLGERAERECHAVGNRAVWTQLRHNPRRPAESYSVVMVYDVRQRKLKQLTSGTRLFNPGLAPDATQLVAVDQRTGRTPLLVVLDAVSGREKLRLDPGFTGLSWPRFTPDGKSVVALAKQRGRLAVWRFSLNGKVNKQLTPWTRHSVDGLYPHGEHVYFSAGFTGIENIFRVPLSGGGRIEQLTSVSVSATTPAVRGDQLYYVEVDAMGDPVTALARKHWLLRPVELTEPVDVPQFTQFELDPEAAEFRRQFMDPARPRFDRLPAEAAGPLPQNGSSAARRPPRYYGLLRGFRFHSWLPEAGQTSLEATLAGDNLLGELSTRTTLGFNRVERKTYLSASATVARSYPWFRLSGGWRSRATQRLAYASTAPEVPSVLELTTVNFDEEHVGVSVIAPLTQVKGPYQLSAQLAGGLDYLNFGGFDSGASARKSLPVAWGGLRASRYRSRARRQIVPRWGQDLSVDFRRGLSGAAAQQLTARVGLFVPTPVPTHGLRVQGAFRLADPFASYQFSDRFSYARGYFRLPQRTYRRLSVDYHFPLLYPDLGAAGVVYVRRVRAVAFGDYGVAGLPAAGLRSVQRTLGVDVMADAIFFNAEPLPVGLRFAYRLDADLGVNRRGWAAPELLVRLTVD